MTLIRAIRLLSNESLDVVSDELGVVPSHLSIIERFGPKRKVGRGLRHRIEERFELPFDTLISPVDGAAIVALMRQQVSAKVGQFERLLKAAA